MKSLVRNTALVIGVTIGGLLLVEIGLRVAGFSYTLFYEPDLVTGSKHRAGAEGWYDKESRVYVRITADGRRDREYTREKPDRVFRVAVFGDSMTEALQVKLEDTYWSVMKRRLPECLALASKRVEVLNFGVAGYGTAQALLALRHRGRNYKPDFVLLGFFVDHDISNNSRRLNRFPKMPYFEFRDGQLVLDSSFRDLPSYNRSWLAVKSVIFAASDCLRIVQLGLKAYGAAVIIPQRRALELPTNPSLSYGTRGWVYAEPSTPEWIEAWRVTEGLIMTMREEAMDIGAGLAVAVLPGVREVHPDANNRSAFARAYGVANTDYPHNRLSAFFDAQAIDNVLLRPAMRAHVKKTGDYLHGFNQTNLGGGHWNERGHLIAGTEISTALCRSLNAG